MSVKDKLNKKLKIDTRVIDTSIPVYVSPENGTWTNQEDVGSIAPFLQASELNRMEEHAKNTIGWININAPEIQRLYDHVDPDITISGGFDSVTELANENYNRTDSTKIDKTEIQGYIEGTPINLGVALINYKSITVALAPNILGLLQGQGTFINEFNRDVGTGNPISITYELTIDGDTYSIIVDWGGTTITITEPGSTQLDNVGIALEKGDIIVENIITPISTANTKGSK